jgi:hypothetical protein
MFMTKHVIFFNDNQEIKRRTSGAYRMANQMQGLGWATSVVDWTSAWTQLELEQYLDKIVSGQTQLFAISYTWMKAAWTQEFIAKLRARYPGRKIIVGGQQFFQKPLGADLCMFGYAELAIEHAINWLFDGGTDLKFTRPIQLGGSALVDCNTAYRSANLGEYSIQYADDDYIQPFEMLTVELSRGCKFACKYCNYAFLGIKEDTSTQAQTLRAELMKNYTRFGTKNYILADDTLNDRMSKLEMLADVVESLPFEPNFASFIRIDLVASKPKQMELLSRARVWAHFYGVETFSQEAGRAVSKGMHPDKIKQALLDMRDHMMNTVGFYRGTLGMIAGLPNETPDSWQASEDWLKTNWSDNSWQWWPLEISLDTLTQTTSIFSKEWEKHGYREINDPVEQKRILRIYDRDTSGVQHKFDTKSLMWTADWADIGQATEFCSKWKNSEWHQQQKLTSNFEILNHWKKDIKPEKILSITDTTTFNQIMQGEQYTKIIQPYITNKLNGVKTMPRGVSYFANRIKQADLKKSMLHSN